MSSVKKTPQPLSFGQNVMAGAFAGMSELLCMYASFPVGVYFLG
jgi:hypothetical protein